MRIAITITAWNYIASTSGGHLEWTLFPIFITTLFFALSEDYKNI